MEKIPSMPRMTVLEEKLDKARAARSSADTGTPPRKKSQVAAVPSAFRGEDKGDWISVAHFKYPQPYVCLPPGRIKCEFSTWDQSVMWAHAEGHRHLVDGSLQLLKLCGQCDSNTQMESARCPMCKRRLPLDGVAEWYLVGEIAW